MSDGLSYAEIFDRIKEIRERNWIKVRFDNFMPEEYKYQAKINQTTISEYRKLYGNNIKENVFIHQ